VLAPTTDGPDQKQNSNIHAGDEQDDQDGQKQCSRLDGGSVPAAAQDADRVARQIMRNSPAGISAIHIRG
jgi:hypothetical protein